MPPPSTATQDITCILNARAGPDGKAAVPEQLAHLFSEHGVSPRILVARGDELLAHARQACANNRIVVAGGGDGTISAVSSVLAGSGAVLGVLPLGTLNHFAKDLGIPLDLAGAVRTILTGRVATVDVGEVNGRVFLNNSSLGAYPQLVRHREAGQHRGHGKWLAFAMAALKTLRHPSLLHVHLQLHGAATMMRRTPLLFVGNNRYSLEGARIGGRIRLGGGKLWICMAPPAGRGRLLRLAVRALTGRLRSDDLDARETSELRVTTRRHRVHVARDGEVTLETSPLRYRIRPGALRVMVPEV